MSYWQIVRHLIPTRFTLFSVSDIGTKLGYLKDSNAVAHSADSDEFYAVIH